MIRHIPRAALTLLVLALPVRAIDIQQVTSPEGIPAWLVEDHSIPFTALSILFRGGASMDAEGARGATVLLTSLLEEGAGTRDATAFAQAAEALGARFSFDAGDDAVTVSARILTENRDASADLLHDALTLPRLDPADVERVRAQLLAVIRSEATDPQSIGAKALAAEIWGDHPYATSVNGTMDSVTALDVNELRAAKDRVLARDRLIVSAAGDVTPEALGALIDRILADLPPAATAPLPPPAPYQGQGGVTVIDWDSPQTVVGFAAPSIPMDDPDYFPAFVLNHILGGGGFSSRLMDEIREKRGLTYGISTTLANQVLGESWQGGMASANDKVAEGVDLIRKVWDDTAKGVTETEVANAKTYLTGEYPLRFDGNGKIAGILSGMQLMGMPRDYVNTRNPKIEAVTLEDVNRAAARLLDSDTLSFILVGRPEGLE